MGYNARGNSGPPVWFIFLLAVAFVFGVYYLWVNFREFMRTGGISVAQATQQSIAQSTVNAGVSTIREGELPTRRPSPTAKPPCQDFEVSAASGNLRRSPSTSGNLIESLPEGTIVCVLQGEQGDDGFVWYFIDRDPVTRVIETGYMREDVVRPINPTPTPSHTPLPAPTITPTYTLTPSDTPIPLPSNTLDPNATPSPTRTPTPTETADSVNI